MRNRLVSGKCKSCGADIMWVKTSGGKSIPCDLCTVYYKQGEGKSKRVVTPNGEVLSCEYTVDPYDATGIGYVPHWATCPQADEWRKNKKEAM